MTICQFSIYFSQSIFRKLNNLFTSIEGSSTIHSIILHESLDNSIWEGLLECKEVDTAYDIFINLLTDELNQVCPIGKIKKKHKMGEQTDYNNAQKEENK